MATVVMLGTAGVMAGAAVLTAAPAQALTSAKSASSAQSAVIGTTTTLTGTPNPVSTGATVTLTATEVATDGTNPAGSVQFEAGTADIGGPVAVNSSGVATTTTTFATSAVMSLSATFTPNSTAYGSSTGTDTEIVTQSAGTIPVQVGVPVPVIVTVPPTGAFSITIPTATAVLTPNSAETAATGSLGTITVTDTRNSYPGWAVYGQETTNFVGSGLPPGVSSYSIPSDNLGWTPAGNVQGGATLGPASADIGATASPALLAEALPGVGVGTDTLNPALSLTLPSSAPTGTFTGGVVITYIETGP